MKAKSRSTRHEVRVARMHDERAHHAHRHLHHLVGVRVVHEGARVLHLELVDEGLADRDVRLRQPADAVHAVRQQDAVPVDRGVLGQLVGDEDAHLVAFDALDRRPRRLAVVAPQVRRHAGRELAAHRLGDEVELLPAVVHAPGQRPAVQRDDRVVCAARSSGTSGGAISAVSRIGASGSDAAPTRDTSAAPKNPAALPARNLLREFIQCPPPEAAPAGATLRIVCMPPGERPVSAICRSDSAIQKSRSASM